MGFVFWNEIIDRKVRVSSPLCEPLHKDRMILSFVHWRCCGNIELFEFEKKKRVAVSLYVCAMTLLRTAMIIYLDFVFLEMESIERMD